jgi:transposase
MFPRGAMLGSASRWLSEKEEWYAHFILKKTFELADERKTLVAIDRGERNLAVEAAMSKVDPLKPIRGQFLKGRN